jgi:hypothetical protein
MPDLYTRAVAAFGENDLGGVAWPYGVSDPDRFNYRGEDGPAQYEERLKDRRQAQRVVTEWAERHGLKKSDEGCCPLWLGRRGSQHYRDARDECGRYGSHTPDRGWLDHFTAWIHGGKPAVITSAPYSVSENEEARIAWWLREDPRLRIARGTGWYGFGTTQIVVWRSDIIPVVELA